MVGRWSQIEFWGSLHESLKTWVNSRVKRNFIFQNNWEIIKGLKWLDQPLHEHTYTHIYTHVHAHTKTIYVCWNTYIHINTQSTCIHTQKHTYINTHTDTHTHKCTHSEKKSFFWARQVRACSDFLQTVVRWGGELVYYAKKTCSTSSLLETCC